MMQRRNLVSQRSRGAPVPWGIPRGIKGRGSRNGRGSADAYCNFCDFVAAAAKAVEDWSCVLGTTIHRLATAATGAANGQVTAYARTGKRILNQSHSRYCASGWYWISACRAQSFDDMIFSDMRTCQR